MPFSLSPEREQQLRGIMARYPNTRAAVLPALWLVQEKEGLVSDEAIEYVAGLLDVPVSDVYGTATFYTMLTRKKLGRHHIQVCTNICCWLRGSAEVLEYIKARLAVDVGGTTEDGNFSISTVECLGACGGAPMMQIDNEYYENLTPERIDEILKKVAGNW